MFTSIVVALDLEWAGDRALPIARSLSQLGDVPVELLTVASPSLPHEFDAFELRRRATANGWPVDSYVILHDNDPARAIVDYVGCKPGALLVISTSAKSRLKSQFLGSVSEAVLNRIAGPVLLVGPHVPAETSMTSTTMIACVDSGDAAAAALPVITSWAQAFKSAPPWVIEVVPSKPLISAGRDFGGRLAQLVDSPHVRELAKQLAAAGVDASSDVLRGGDIVAQLEEFASEIDNAVLVAASTNWTDDHIHWHSTTRRLVQRTTRPVLVVPARGGVGSAGQR